MFNSVVAEDAVFLKFDVQTFLMNFKYVILSPDETKHY